MADHALLSPSGASRWLTCTPSARLEAEMPESSSVYADEGTLAHDLVKLLLQNELRYITEADYKFELKFIKANELYTEDMLSYCIDHTAMVMSYVQQYGRACKRVRVFLETQFDLSEYIPESFGTADTIIVADNLLHVIDLKYGKGVPVSAIDNSQMKVYALGAWSRLGDLFDSDTVKMTISQPRIENDSTYSMSIDALLLWAKNELRIKAAVAYAGEGEFIVGDHCQFCRIKPTCRAFYNKQMEIAVHDFKEPPLLTPAEVADLLGRSAMIKGWITAVDEYALDQAVNKGVAWPGFKLVQGRSNRKYTDTGKVYEVLIENKYDPGKIGEFKVFGITEMEKNITKPKFAELLTPYVTKPPGKLKLAPDTDPRPAHNSAAEAVNDFNDGFKTEIE